MYRTVKVLNELEKHGFYSRWALAGAMGLNYYIDPVETHDLDVFVFLTPTPRTVISDIQPLYKELTRRGYSTVEEHVLIEGVPVQFMDVGKGLETEALAEALETTYRDEAFRVIGIEHLMAMMLQLGRSKDNVRLVKVLCEHSDRFSIEKLDDILTRYKLTPKYSRFRKEHHA